MKDHERRKCSFDHVAELYDQVRPTYPDELVEDILRLSGIPPGSRILEIGCGTGKATVLFARRGYEMVCIEPGARMAGVAAGNCRDFPGVRIENTTFEEWPLGPRAFDLVFAAQSFHWVDPDTGYARSADALRDSGSLALFWNFFPRPDTPLFEALDDAYRRHAPGIEASRSWEERVRGREQEMTASGRFGPVEVRRYPWQSSATADEHVRFLSTQSDHIILEPARREKLLAAVRAAIEAHGGTITRPVVAVLFLARKRTTALR